MRNALLIITTLMGAGLIAAAPAHAINYDCSKPGNANKTACKGKVPPAPVAAAPAAPAKAAVTTTTKSVPTRHYDCSKAGNANKAACAGVAAAKPAPVAAAAPARPSPPAAAPAPTAASRPAAASAGRTVAWTTKTGKVVHYDCSKAGNLNKQACK